MAEKTLGLTATWSLSESSTNVLAVTRGVLQAATSDNVQPLCLLAVEAFGNTLPVCQQTQMIVEKEASRRDTTMVLKFLQAQIGYAAHDAAYQLTSSNAGVRFLSLASAILNVGSDFQAARCLDLMIKDTASKDQLLPPLGQLKDLLIALKPKLMRMRTSFCDDVIGWRTYLMSHSKTWIDLKPLRNDIINDASCPSDEEIRALVTAFRVIYRVGEMDQDAEIDEAKVQIRLWNSFSWVIAFTKWLLGMPPHVIDEDGLLLIDQPESKVSIVLKNLVWEIAMEVEIVRSIGRPSELLEASRDSSSWSGLVSLESYGQCQLTCCGLPRRNSYCRAAHLRCNGPTDPNPGYNAAFQAVSCGMFLVASSLRCHVVQQRALRKYAYRLFPCNETIAETFSKYMGCDSHQIGDSSSTESVWGLPLVRSWEEHLLANPDDDGDIAVADFRRDIASITCDILVLSLYQSVEPLRLLWHCEFSPQDNKLLDAVCAILENGISPVIEWNAILSRALRIVGQPLESVSNSPRPVCGKHWVATSAHGQVVLPACAELLGASGDQLLRLICVPGTLRYKGVSYEVVQQTPSPLNILHSERPVTGPKNFTKQGKCHWQTVVGDRKLELSLGTAHVPNFGVVAIIMENASKSLFISSCSHDMESKVDPPDKEAYYVSPYKGNLERSDKRIAVAAVAGNEDMRVLALSTTEPAIIRGRACLACCLDICRQAGMNYVIA